MAFEEISLYDYLKANKDKIWYVQLTYTWNRIIMVETPLYFIDESGRRHELYGRWTANQIDEEYSFIGTYEEALEFADSYGVWDGCPDKDGLITGLTLENGVLIGEQDGYDPNAENYPEDDPAADDLRDLEFTGLVYYYRNSRGNTDRRFYRGDKVLIKTEDDEDDN